MIKSADKGSAVVVWDREDYIKEAEKQLGDEQVYEEVSNDAAPLLKAINQSKNKKTVWSEKRQLGLFYYERPKICKVLSPT